MLLLKTLVQMYEQWVRGKSTGLAGLSKDKIFTILTQKITDDIAADFINSTSPGIVQEIKEYIYVRPQVGDGRSGLNHRGVEILRDSIGPPLALSQSLLDWNGGTIVRLGRSIRDERAFDRMPILADALQDAGHADTAVLDHLRGPGPHFRSCFVLQGILGES